MPRTRAQRRHALATALDEDTLSYVLSFLPKLGVVPGRLYTLAGGARAKTGKHELSLKAVLAPRRRRLIKCPDDIPLLENAVAAAREGDVVLLTESVELQAPIVAPPFHVTIAAVSRRRFGRYRSDNVPPGQSYHGGLRERMLGRPSGGACVYVNTNNFTGRGDSESDVEERFGASSLSAAVVASGKKVRLELHGIALVGEELDDGRADEGPLFLPLAIDAQDGASVVVENVWISKLATAALRASGGARIVVRDATIGRSVHGVLAQDDGAIIVENCLFNGGHVLGVSAYRGGRVDVRSCSIDCCFVAGVSSTGDGSHIRIHKMQYISRPQNDDDQARWSPRFVVRRGGGVTFSATENETYNWVPATFEDALEDGGELVEGDGWELDGFEDLPGDEPGPVLSLTSAVHGANMIVSSHVRQEIEHKGISQFRFGAGVQTSAGYISSTTYIDA